MDVMCKLHCVSCLLQQLPCASAECPVRRPDGVSRRALGEQQPRRHSCSCLRLHVAALSSSSGRRLGRVRQHARGVAAPRVRVQHRARNV